MKLKSIAINILLLLCIASLIQVQAKSLSRHHNKQSHKKKILFRARQLNHNSDFNEENSQSSSLQEEQVEGEIQQQEGNNKDCKLREGQKENEQYHVGDKYFNGYNIAKINQVYCYDTREEVPVEEEEEVKRDCLLRQGQKPNQEYKIGDKYFNGNEIEEINGVYCYDDRVEIPEEEIPDEEVIKKCVLREGQKPNESYKIGDTYFNGYEIEEMNGIYCYDDSKKVEEEEEIRDEEEHREEEVEEVEELREEEVEKLREEEVEELREEEVEEYNYEIPLQVCKSVQLIESVEEYENCGEEEIPEVDLEVCQAISSITDVVQEESCEEYQLYLESIQEEQTISRKHRESY